MLQQNKKSIRPCKKRGSSSSLSRSFPYPKKRRERVQNETKGASLFSSFFSQTLENTAFIDTSNKEDAEKKEGEEEEEPQEDTHLFLVDR